MVALTAAVALLFGAGICEPTPAVPPATGVTDRPVLSADGHALSKEELEVRCRLIDQLKHRGLAMQTPLAARIMTELMRRYSSVVDISGETPLPKLALDYLLQQLPDTARMVNFYGDTRYDVAYLDQAHSRFFATNNRSMQAEFTYIDKSSSTLASSYLLFESGESKLLFWKFAGNTLLELSFKRTGETSAYSLRIYIFTDSRAFNLFFGSALFKGLMRSMFNRILADVVKAARRLADSNDAIGSDNPLFANALRERLQ